MGNITVTFITIIQQQHYIISYLLLNIIPYCIIILYNYKVE